MNILDDMGVSKLSAKVFLKVNYSFNELALGQLNLLRLTQFIYYG